MRSRVPPPFRLCLAAATASPGTRYARSALARRTRVPIDPDRTPDVRDGLSRIERVILWQLSVLEAERGGRMVPTAQLYGRVVEHVDISVEELQRILERLIGTR